MHLPSLLTKYSKLFAYGVLIISAILMTFVILEISMAKERFADELISRSISQTESELDDYFERVEDLLYALTDQYETGFWNLMSPEKVMLHSISLVENYASVSSLGIADGEGYEFNLLPDSMAGYWKTRRVYVDKWGYTAKWERWSLEDTLKQVRQWEEPLAVDTKERPWYIGAIETEKEVFWTAPYRYTTSPDMGITAAVHIPHRSGLDSLSTIVAVDLTLRDLNRFVDDLLLTRQQKIFLLTSDDRRVVATNAEFGDRNEILESTSEIENSLLTEVLNTEPNRNAFPFEADGKRWWGIRKPYEISEGRQIHIVSVLPEEDFAMEITRTLWIGIGSFFLILMSSLVVVSNHNKLHRIGNTLSRKNELVSQQKKFLFSEVHHRVKNNLALISAFLELEILNMDKTPAVVHLQRNQRRIRIIALIQEEVYRSNDLGSVTAEAMISEMVKYLERKTPDITYQVQTEEISINVNQALTYGLLLNELLDSLDQAGNGSPSKVHIAVERVDSVIRTVLSADGISFGNSSEATLIQDMTRAYLSQLNAEFESVGEDNIVCIITFEPVEKSGIVGNKLYKA